MDLIFLLGCSSIIVCSCPGLCAGVEVNESAGILLVTTLRCILALQAQAMLFNAWSTSALYTWKQSMQSFAGSGMTPHLKLKQPV